MADNKAGDALNIDKGKNFELGESVTRIRKPQIQGFWRYKFYGVLSIFKWCGRPSKFCSVGKPVPPTQLESAIKYKLGFDRDHPYCPAMIRE
jgi:hypothetical protein